MYWNLCYVAVSDKKIFSFPIFHTLLLSIRNTIISFRISYVIISYVFHFFISYVITNIIFTGDLNFPTIDRQIETADGGTHENQVQANAFLQFAQEQCLHQYREEPMRKNNILDVFLTNNDQLTRQIIITETSMSDHNIIQIETNIKIVEEK